MKKRLTALATVAAICTATCGCTGKSGNGGSDFPSLSSNVEETEIVSFDNTVAPVSERIGITNWGATYMPGLKDGEYSLIKGAETILETGSYVIKVACSNPASQYPLDDWSDLDRKECVDVLKFPVFKTLWEMDFRTYFISITEAARVNYADGLSAEEAETVEKEFYEATKYLLETYRGSGKTFILQNWETDNYVGYSVDGQNAEYVFRNYAKYFNARQDGINRAREEFTMSAEKNVYVFGALEINRLDPSYTSLRAVDCVVPYTYADLYTYSSYEFKDKEVVTSAKEIAGKLSEALAYYKSRLPSAAVYPQKVYFGDKRLAITEFGYPDKADGYSGEWQKTVTEGHVLALLSSDLQYAVYWQLCCNEPTGSNAAQIKALSWMELRKYRFSEGELNGFYLLRPDGSETLTCEYLKDIFNGEKLR